MQPADLYPASSMVPRAEDQSARSILVVDDDAAVQQLMIRWLESGGYNVATADTAEDALELLRANASAVALCDIRLPGHDGLWLASRIEHEFPETAVIVASGVQDVASIGNLPLGVVDYLMKPFGRDRLREAVWRGIEWHTAAFEARRLKEALERDVHVRQGRLVDTVAMLRLDSEQALDAMLVVLTLSCHEIYTHAYRVAALAVRTARDLELPAGEVAAIERGALLHDFGKLAMPEAILRKPAPLTPPEQELIRQHPAIAYQLIAHLPYLEDAAVIVRDAQERIDGLGYPRGVPAEEISIGARIVSVADAYDTMTRPRSYRDPISPAEAIAELERCAGTQFDARVVDSFRRIIATQ